MNSELINAIKTATQPAIDVFLHYGIPVIIAIGIIAVIILLISAKAKK